MEMFAHFNNIHYDFAADLFIQIGMRDTNFSPCHYRNNANT